jgi:pyruvate/2-oxoglutarate dehydrogenase complex dihydrolipoamide dehydrogenase (E3) component
MADNDRAVAEARTEGAAVLIISQRGALLGASLLAPHAGEAIGLWVQAIGRKIPLSALAGLMLPYPTMAEAGKRAAAVVAGERLFSPAVRRLVRALGRLP